MIPAAQTLKVANKARGRMQNNPKIPLKYPDHDELFMW
jgi:hypothetical protein